MKKIILIAALLILTACTSPLESPVPVSPTDSLAPSAETVAPTDLPPTATPAPTATPEFIPYETPDWFKNAVLYEIFVRSFADSDGNGIGDINGITQNLDYIESLNVDVIWLMPIHPSPSDHGYDVTDFFAVHPLYGTIEDLQILVEEAHKRDIKIILDLVASHLSNQNPLFKSAYGNPGSEYEDWFSFTNDGNTTYNAFAGLNSLPRFNHYNPEVVDYLMEVVLFWMDLDGDGDYSDGVDGYRVDNAIFPPHDFFVQMRQTMKHANPDSLLLGEVWVETVSRLEPFFVDEFDALFDFPLYATLSGGPEGNGDGVLAGELPASLLTRAFENRRTLPAEAIPVTFVSNHDTNRIASDLLGDWQRQKAAAAFTALIPGAVALYYGEEIGMPGEKGGPPYWDNYRREPMDWYQRRGGEFMTTWFRQPDSWNQPFDGISVEEQDGVSDSLLTFYREMLAIRKTWPALVEGDFNMIPAAALGRRAWVVVRQSEQQTLIAFFNFHKEASTITIDAFPFTADVLTDYFSGTDFDGAIAGEPYSIDLDAGGFVWFVVEK